VFAPAGSLRILGGKLAGSLNMLQQVSALAPSVPHDRGLVAGEALGAAPGGQPAGEDFLALLAQAEGQEGVPPAGDVVAEGSAGDHALAGLPMGLAAGLVPATSAPTHEGEPLGAAGQDGGEAGLAAAVVTDPAISASPQPMIALQGAVTALPISLEEGSAQPATGAAQPMVGLPVPPSQDEVPPFRLTEIASGFAAAGREAAPASRTALVAKVPPDEVAGGEGPAVTSASDPDSVAPAQAAFQDLAEGFEPASGLRAEAGPSYLTGSTPSLIVSPSLPEGRGLSMPVDPSIAGAGTLPGYLAPGLSSPPPAASLALPYQRLFHPQLAAQVAPAVLSMGVVPGADGGPGRLTVAIRPAELGTLQIITDRTEDGTARIAVLAERPETLQLLLRDAPTLESALRASGVDEGGGLSLTFGLASQGQGDRGEDARGEPGRPAGRLDGADAKPAVIASAPAMARASLLDLSL
jgi:flagellar hook-length control protein FliK